MDCGSGAKELAVKVDRHHLAPLFECHVLKGRARLDPGIVDQDVDGSKAPAGFGKHRLDVIALTDICSKGKSLAALGLQFLDEFPCIILIAGKMVDNNAAPGLDQGQRATTSDAGGCAGHNRNLTCQAKAFVSL